MVIQTAVLMALLLAGVQAQPALRVVVIEGEDAVNITQQKTAVRPLVEVRDRNNLPVPGAVVTFSIQGGASTFGGASTLTVATNAAGQAAVTGLTPSAAGAFQIQVSAAFQGQVATATIAQTNVMTAAQAAAAAGASGGGSSAGSAGGAGGGGAGGGAGGAAAGGAGGLSTTTLVVAGAAVAGGAVAASQLVDSSGGSGDSIFSGTISGSIVANPGNGGPTSTCSYVRSASASAELKFEDFSDSSVRGKFAYEGTDTVTSTSCPTNSTVPTPPSFIGQVDLTGTPSRFSGRNVFATPTGTGVDGGTTTGEHVYTFEGSISGNTATGTFRYEQKSQSAGGGGGGGTVQQQAVGTFTITFTKS